MHQAGQVTRLDQSWGMFAPFPVRDDGWNVIHGKLQNGQDIDLIRGTEGVVKYDKPQDCREIYPNQRWHKFLTNLRYNDYSSSLLQYGRWLCRSNNAKRERGQKLSTFEILYMEEYTVAVDQVKPIRKRILWSHDCFK
jgi:hypothetical protein